eukprot:551283_1
MFKRFTVLRYTHLHYSNITHGYFRHIPLQQHLFWRREFSNGEHKEEQTKNESKSFYSAKQLWARFGTHFMSILTAAMILFTWNFKKNYVDPRKALLKKDETYQLDGKKREKMVRDLANKFPDSIAFITDKNENIKGIDVLAHEKFFILYFGLPNCNDKCLDILQIIKTSLQNNKLQKYKDMLSILYIDINIFDSPEKLTKFFTETLKINKDSNVNIIGLIPKDMDTLKDLMESFSIHIYKRDGNGENLILDHSNMVYFVDKDGLLYDLLGGNDEINEVNIIEKTHNLLYHSESTFLGKLRNTLSLAFQTRQITQMPDRWVKGREEMPETE